MQERLSSAHDCKPLAAHFCSDCTVVHESTMPGAYGRRRFCNQPFGLTAAVASRAAFVYQLAEITLPSSLDWSVDERGFRRALVEAPTE
jgi:hypothetical protein